MRIHHLNCGSLCPRGGRMFGGAGGPLKPAPMCCHCLLIEGDDRLILVDTGLGVEDVNDPRRLGFLFNAMTRPRLAVAETALRQVADLGFRPDDVRDIVPTHLDLDHAGGMGDFPGAAVHVFATELRAASNPSGLRERGRYRAVQIAAVKTWAPVEADGEAWFGFRRCARFPVRATRCCWSRFQVTRAGIAASRSGCRRAGSSIAATRISIIPRSQPAAALRLPACASTRR